MKKFKLNPKFIRIHIDGDILKYFLTKVKASALMIAEKNIYEYSKTSAISRDDSIILISETKLVKITYINKKGKLIIPVMEVYDTTKAGTSNLIFTSQITEVFAVEDSNEINEVIIGTGIYTEQPIKLSMLSIEPLKIQ